jgi:hypothetical protein
MRLMADARSTGSIVVAIALLIPVAASAQRGSDAGLVGTIRDSAGAVVPDAIVTVSSPQLIGGPRAAAMTEHGVYRVLLLPAGMYKIVVQHDGFKTIQRAGIELAPGSTLTVGRMMVAEHGKRSPDLIVYMFRLQALQVVDICAADHCVPHHGGFAGAV